MHLTKITYFTYFEKLKSKMQTSELKSITILYLIGQNEMTLNMSLYLYLHVFVFLYLYLYLVYTCMHSKEEIMKRRTN